MQFDYVIVGGGSAGCVLANRLSADPKRQVLMIEAGGWDRNPLLHVPGGLLPIMKKGLYQWPYLTTAQSHVNDRVMSSPRGKVIGGSGSINGMSYSRGMAADYQHWPSDGTTGWSYQDVLPYFRRLENFAPVQDDFHGSHGLVRVTRHRRPHVLTDAFVRAGAQAGYPFTADHSGTQFEGITPIDMTVAKGVRSSTASCYLKPALRRRNLRVLAGTHVTRILVENRRAIGVEYMGRGHQGRAWAAREVVLSAGALASPQLLMLSGIGPASHLRDHGITVLHDAPGVGSDLQDHFAVPVSYECISPISLDRHLSWTGALSAAVTYLATRRGPLAQTPHEATAFLRTTPGAPPEIQLYFIPALFRLSGKRRTRGYGCQMSVSVLRPTSRGRVSLRSSNPSDLPIFDPNFMADEYDRVQLRRGVQMARALFAQPALKSYLRGEIMPGSTRTSDSDIDAYIRENGQPFYHSVATCRMGTDSRAVVDPQLRVRHIEHLRVVDASIIPRIISGGLYIPVVMLAERAADLIMGAPPPSQFVEGNAAVGAAPPARRRTEPLPN